MSTPTVIVSAPLDRRGRQADVRSRPVGGRKYSAAMAGCMTSGFDSDALAGPTTATKYPARAARVSTRRITAAASMRLLAVIPVQLVGRLVFHDARHLADEVLAVAGAAQQVKAHLHAGGGATGGDDAPGV